MIGVSKCIPAIVAGSSLVGIRRPRNYPLSFGNYFSLYRKGKGENPYCDSISVWNFWYENFEEARKRFLTDNKVHIIQYSNGCIINDPRIPSDWYHYDLCFTGGYPPDSKELEEIRKIMKDIKS